MASEAATIRALGMAAEMPLPSASVPIGTWVMTVRSDVVAYEVPECEFLSGGLYGHPAPKRAAEPSNRAGVSAGGPAYGRLKPLTSIIGR